MYILMKILIYNQQSWNNYHKMTVENVLRPVSMQVSCYNPFRLGTVTVLVSSG